MPLFDYICESCGKKKELLTKSSEKVIICPYCGKHTFNRQLSSPSGFDIRGYCYKNEYKNS